MRSSLVRGLYDGLFLGGASQLLSLLGAPPVVLVLFGFYYAVCANTLRGGTTWTDVCAAEKKEDPQ